jgi:hypothetical protein
MKLIKNIGSDRVIDELRRVLAPRFRFDIASPEFSLFAFGELREHLSRIARCRLIVPSSAADVQALIGSDADRHLRNRLQTRRLAKQCVDWIDKRVEVRSASGSIPQSALVVRNADSQIELVISGECSFTTRGLGLAPGNPFALIQSHDSADERLSLGEWFNSIWNGMSSDPHAKIGLIESLQTLIKDHEPSLIYYLILYHLFKDQGDELDEERIVKTATGIRESAVWRKLFKFQRDGVIGAIDKIERHGGCVIADSVGLGKTFEALAIIKYYELRNDRVLVLCPKRLRDNWTMYKSNDRRNILASDRFHYDVLNHTDLSRDRGSSGDVDLSHINWGNYDLLVIDESHNFRNKAAIKDRETRYDRLMRRVVKEGVKTRVLMLSATPVNNRLADFKNQIAFITEGDDSALAFRGVPSVEATIRKAQVQFNRWQDLPDPDRTPVRLLDMLGFDYFKLLDLLTIARSRKHIEKYYGTNETGRFPERLKPINIKPDVDLSGEFRSIHEINSEIRRLNLGSYAPLRYVFPHKLAAYEAKYGTKIQGGDRLFRQIDREENLVHLMRVNILKRMESAVPSFALTLERQLRDVESILEKIDRRVETNSEFDVGGFDFEDPDFDNHVVGRKVKVLMGDVDIVRWRQDLIEDRDRIAELYHSALQVSAARDAKLDTLKNIIQLKVDNPINPGNRKVIVFTAFADTARYLYDQIAPWAHDRLGLHSAIVTGAGRNKTTLETVHPDLAGILSSFSPRSKERPIELASEGEIDLLIATDCISEGQNLQDCDYLINYDIHWNPVRIIQRFGRIDRIGSPNERIQLVNFWPNIEIEEYINLEQRVTGRMVLVDLSATGDENIIEADHQNRMNDLAYRRKQLLKLQESVIDLDDLSSGLSITDLSLNDFRIDLTAYLKENPRKLDKIPLGTFAVTTSTGTGDDAIPPGAIFHLRAVDLENKNNAQTKQEAKPDYLLDPHYLVHVGLDGAVLIPFTRAKPLLDRLKKHCRGRDFPEENACSQFNALTRDGENMSLYQKMLASAVASIVGKKEERAVASLFSPGGTHANRGEFHGMNDFEVVAFLVILPQEDSIC